MQLVMVLNDGETFAMLDGCFIALASSATIEKVESGDAKRYDWGQDGSRVVALFDELARKDGIPEPVPIVTIANTVIVERASE